MSKVPTHVAGVVRKPLADRTNVATTRRGVQTKLNVGESRKKALVADGTMKMKAASTTSSSKKATTSLKTTSKVTSSKTRTQAKVAAQASSAQSTPEHAWTVSDFEVGRPLYVLRCNPSSFLPFAHPKFSIVRFTLKRAGQIRYVTHRRSSSKADCCLCSSSSWLRRSSVPGQGEEVRLCGGHQGALQA